MINAAATWEAIIYPLLWGILNPYHEDNHASFSILLAVAALDGFLTTPCWAKNELYVAVNGNDHRPGTKEKPFQSINRAVSAAKPGDVILVGDGVYRQGIWLNKSGKANAWITLRPLHLVNVHKERPRVKIAPKRGDAAISLNEQSYLRIEGLEIDGGSWGIVSSGKKIGHHTVIANNLVHDTEACFRRAVSGIEDNGNRLARLADDHRLILRHVEILAKMVLEIGRSDLHGQCPLFDQKYREWPNRRTVFSTTGKISHRQSLVPWHPSWREGACVRRSQLP